MDEENIVKIKIPNTKFWILGKQKENHLWDIQLFNPATNFKEIVRTDTTTESFVIFSNVILKTPFPNIKK